MNGQGVVPGSTASAAACSSVLEVPAELSSLTLVEKMTENLCSEIPLEATKTDAIVLSVSEAMSNALLHGCLCDTASTIRLDYQRVDLLLKVRMTDSGSELPESVIARYRKHVVEMPATTDLTELLPEGGWGINLILQGTSEVSYQRVEGLNHLTLCFALKA